MQAVCCLAWNQLAWSDFGWDHAMSFCLCHLDTLWNGSFSFNGSKHIFKAHLFCPFIIHGISPYFSETILNSWSSWFIAFDKKYKLVLLCVNDHGVSCVPRSILISFLWNNFSQKSLVNNKMDYFKICL